MIVCIAHGIKSKGEAESYKYDGNHAAHMRLKQYMDKYAVRFNVERATEIKQSAQYRIGKTEAKENQKVNCRNAKEKKSFARFPVC